MDRYKLKFTNLQNEIFRLLCIKSGASLNQREISNILKFSPTAVSKSLVYLQENNFIILEQDPISKRFAINLNRDNQFVMQLKRVDNLKLIYESGLADVLQKEYAGASIILFGNYSRGDDTIKSDIDLAVIGRKDKKIDLTKFEKYLEREININFYSSLKTVHKELRENICNGIVLIGGIEL